MLSVSVRRGLFLAFGSEIITMCKKKRLDMWKDSPLLMINKEQFKIFNVSILKLADPPSRSPSNLSFLPKASIGNYNIADDLKKMHHRCKVFCVIVLKIRS